jgi:hypothetical protein
MRRTVLAFALLALLAALPLARADESNPGTFRPLFNGKDLTGWVQHGGKAQYSIDGDTIVGTAVPNTPNSFLCTDRDYGDFILELEFKVDPLLNSGVQIRSCVFDEPHTYEYKSGAGDNRQQTIEPGRVHGYQVEIDPSDRAWTAGIYDEGRRGWLFNLEKNEAAQKAFRQNEWNKFRVECRGASIKTWLNDVPAADLTDDVTPRGFIALQVHSIGEKEAAGKQVRWRNIRLQEL